MLLLVLLLLVASVTTAAATTANGSVLRLVFGVGFGVELLGNVERLWSLAASIFVVS